jgi:hypothetical protein
MQNQKHECTEISVASREPITQIMSFFKLNPVNAGLLFFCFVSLPLTIWGSFSTPEDSSKVTNQYFYSIAWSVTILTIFPLLIGLTVKYYSEIPILIQELLSHVSAEAPQGLKKEYLLYFSHRFSNRYAWPVFCLITLLINYVFLYQFLRGPIKGLWGNGEHLKWLFNNSPEGLSPVGIFAITIQLGLVYWLINVAWNSFLLSNCLHKLFATFQDYISLNPVHPDGCCGLRRLGSIAMIFSSIIFLIGMYISINVIDHTLIQGQSLFSDIGLPICLACYAVFAPVLFFLPLSTAHRTMQREKDAFLLPLANKSRKMLTDLCNDNDVQRIDTFRQFGNIYRDLDKNIPVWPFDLRSIQTFFGTIVVPVVPVAITILVELMKRK